MTNSELDFLQYCGGHFENGSIGVRIELQRGQQHFDKIEEQTKKVEYQTKFPLTTFFVIGLHKGEQVNRSELLRDQLILQPVQIQSRL
jgi:hypothetical protein